MTYFRYSSLQKVGIWAWDDWGGFPSCLGVGVGGWPYSKFLASTVLNSSPYRCSRIPAPPEPRISAGSRPKDSTKLRTALGLPWFIPADVYVAVFRQQIKTNPPNRKQVITKKELHGSLQLAVSNQAEFPK